MTQINQIKNEKGKFRTENAEIQRIIKDYYEQLYEPIKWTTLKKWTNSKKSTAFQNRARKKRKPLTPITSRKIETGIKKKKNFQQTKAQGQLASHANSTKTVLKR